MKPRILLIFFRVIPKLQKSFYVLTIIFFPFLIHSFLLIIRTEGIIQFNYLFTIQSFIIHLLMVQTMYKLWEYKIEQETALIKYMITQVYQHIIAI